MGDYAAQLEVLAIVLGAMLLGGLVGFEREQADRPAGLRTHMLVAGAAALLTKLSTLLVLGLDADINPDVINTDPIRVVEAIVTGVAFLGAGTIFRGNGTVEGLTTAASLLWVAAIGIAIALDQYIIAVGMNVLGLITLRALRQAKSA